VVNLGAAAASLFALGYGRHEESPERILPFYPAFLAGMNLVVLADDAFTFLVAWEFMSLSSCALVMAHHRDPENVRAGYIYLVMAGIGTLALLLAFGALAGHDGGYSFAAIRASTPSTTVAAFAFWLALFGAGSKAGLVPLHVWLPLAHPAAPSHVSALMSGVMTKVAVYGFIRIVFDLLGSPPWWWGAVLLAIGGATAFIGILSATLQRDLKKLLAYSTVENVGVIFAGLGLALAFRASGLRDAAALAATAALFHVFNHAMFKSLLFFGAGAVLNATGERNIEKLGGLIHRMPHTAFAFLVGCVAISALPPLNGFVSEWLTFQAILLSPELPRWGPQIHRAGGRRAARAVRRARGRVLRARVRRDLPRPSAHTARRAGAGSRPPFRSRRCLYSRDSASSSALFPDSSSTASRRWSGPRRRAHAGADLLALALDRAGDRKPQLLQRTARLPVRPRDRVARRLCDPSRRFRRAPPRAAVGLRLPRIPPP
jgi:hypothetical protein